MNQKELEVVVSLTTNFKDAMGKGSSNVPVPILNIVKLTLNIVFVWHLMEKATFGKYLALNK